MRRLRRRFSITALRDDQSGATAIEYMLIVAIFAIGIIAAIGTMGGSLGLRMDGVVDTICDATQNCAD